MDRSLIRGYNLCQFFNWQCGKNPPLLRAGVRCQMARYTRLRLIIALSGIRPLELFNYSIIFGMAIMPFAYYPILRVASDKEIMRQHVNTKADIIVGIFFLLMIAAAVAAIPLMILTHSGRP